MTRLLLLLCAVLACASLFFALSTMRRETGGAPIGRNQILYVSESTCGQRIVVPDYVSGLISPYLLRQHTATHSQLEARATTNKNVSTMNTTQTQIPRIIHQTYKTNELPERFSKMRRTILDQHPEYQHILWTDDSMRVFIAANYSWFLSTYDGYRYNIQRVDAFRYFALYHFGGIYADLDIGALCPFDVLLNYGAVLPETDPVGFSNDFMAARRGHPFFKYLMESLEQANMNFAVPYLTVMLASGSTFVSYRYHMAPAAAVNDIRILHGDLYGSTMLFHMQKSNDVGSTWHHDVSSRWIAQMSFGWLIILIVLSAASIVVWMLRKGNAGRSPSLRLPRCRS